MRERGIVHPFAIQELSLPLGLKGHDIIGQARTGTGKTLGFGLPLLQRIDPDKAKTQALVIVPTRELCIQVADDLTVGSTRGITSIAVYGGVGYEEQIEALTTGVHVVVGTPGRTLDHLGRGNLDVSQIHTVVLDEADEMLDMGFLPDVEKLLADVPVDRQTLLFSATMPTAIVKLARRFMEKPTFMRADETLHETAPTVDQHFFLVHRMDKPRVLARLLQMPGRGGAFVFCRTKRMCDRLVRELEPLGVRAIAVHGDLRQSTREKNLDQFRAGKADVLVATEVAARGLDVSNVTHVINYDCPDDEKMYLHRIGRTARAGESGVAVTFGEFNEVDRVNVIRKRVGVEDELTEVFSTSSLLTELFDLPETTPWDDFGKSDDGGRGSRGSSGRSGGSRSSSGGGTGSSGGKGSSGGGRSSSRGDDRSSSRGSRRSSASSSGSNRSSGRGSDRRGGEGDEHEQRRTSADSDSSRSRTRTRTRSRAGSRTDRDTNGSSRESSSRDSSNRDSSSRDSSSRDRRDADSTSSSRNGGGSNGRRTDDTRARGDRKDSGRGGRDRRTGNRNDDGGNDGSTGRSKDDGTTTSRTNESSGRTTGGARKRARRGRRSQDEQRDDATSSRASSSTGSGTSQRDSGSTSSDGGGASRRGGRGRDDRSRTSRGRSSDGDRSGRGSSNGRTDENASTTRRGSDARGSGTPRLDRRVDVEHLP
nr:DEAD/DEAH box helicase [Salsipaludibacter albus]